jgi:PAS domain S-box-containing protein
MNNETGFKALFEQASIAILVIDLSGNIQMANPHIKTMFGYDVHELIGQPVEILIPESLRHNHQHHRDSYFHKPKARPMGLGMELKGRKKDGSIFHVEISLGHYRVKEEALEVGFITDITERIQSQRIRQLAEEKLLQINEELEAKVKERTRELTHLLEREKELNDIKSRFVSMASHEFRTPLSAVSSSIYLIEQYGAPEHEEKRNKHIRRIRSSVKNLIDILNDFLSLDKLEQGKVDTVKEQILVQEFARDVIEEVSNLYKKGQDIIYLHTGANELFLDKKILKNILLNLLSNAIKYSPEDKEIYLETAVLADTTTIIVKDSGIGIPPDDQKYLFTKFFRASNAGSIQGTGLGLNIVKRYVELLDGNIEFKSTPGEGTTFTVQFKICAGA